MSKGIKEPGARNNERIILPANILLVSQLLLSDNFTFLVLLSFSSFLFSIPFLRSSKQPRNQLKYYLLRASFPTSDQLDESFFKRITSRSRSPLDYLPSIFSGCATRVAIGWSGEHGPVRGGGKSRPHLT